MPTLCKPEGSAPGGFLIDFSQRSYEGRIHYSFFFENWFSQLEYICYSNNTQVRIFCFSIYHTINKWIFCLFIKLHVQNMKHICNINYHFNIQCFSFKGLLVQHGNGLNGFDRMWIFNNTHAFTYTFVVAINVNVYNMSGQRKNFF